MSATDLERIEAQLQEIRALVEQKLGALPRQLFPLPEAAQQLGVKMTKMRELVALRAVGTVTLGGRQMVPASEIHRLSYVEPPKVLPPKVARLAASLSKLREPIPGAREAAVRVRAAKRNLPAQTQDPAALRAALKRR